MAGDRYITKKHKGSITVFLTLIMLTMLVLTSCIIESVKIQNMKSYQRIVNESAIQSVFGEYNKTLRDSYGILAIDGSYMTSFYSEDNLLDRFKYYGGSVDRTNIEGIQLLTDNNCSALREQIIYYMESNYGLDYISNITGELGSWEELDLGELETSDEKVHAESQMDELSEVLGETQEGGGLLEGFKGFDLDVVFALVSKNIEVSTASAIMEELPSVRDINRGFGNTYQLDYNTLAEKTFVVEYIGKFLPHAVQTQEMYSEELEGESVSEVAIQGMTGSNELKYQQEYLLGAKNSDKENLKNVVHKLLLLRTPVNYAYLLTDTVKKGEAAILAGTLCVASAGTIPQEAIYQTLL